MQLGITLIIIVGLVALVATLLLAGKSDTNYNSSAKKNMSFLTLIYIVAILGSLIGLVVYIAS